MKNFFAAINRKLNIWMRGRYGADELNRAMLFAALAMILLSAFPGLEILNSIALLLLLLAMFRMCSKNTLKRRGERDAWLRFTGNIKSWFVLQKRRFKDRKSYKYFRCKQCGTVLRVPVGKGKLKIVCRKCGSEMSGKT